MAKSAGSPFEHLPLVRTAFGDSRPRKPAAIPANPTTAHNKSNRANHSSVLRNATASTLSRWLANQERRRDDELPEIECGILLLLQIDTSLDLDTLRRQFQFEIVSEQEDGYVIVVSEDTKLETLQAKLTDFENEVDGSATIAMIHELVDDESQDERLRRILTEQLYSEWPSVKDDSEYLVDVSIACLGSWQIRKKPKRNPRWKPDTWARKENEWSNHRIEIYDAWDELKDRRLESAHSILDVYGCEVLSNWDNAEVDAIDLPDSFTLRIRISGKGLRDFVLNFAYVWEVSEPDEIETPQQIARDLKQLEQDLKIIAPPSDAPTVCVIDSGIQEAHLYLEPAIRGSDSKCFLIDKSESDVVDQVRPGGHGTRVAGALLFGESIPGHGDIELESWIQNARVLDENSKLPLEMLPAAVIRSVVSHFNRGPSPTRLFNHSVNTNVSSRRRHMSSWAAEIDRLSHERDILIIQSAGNIRQSSPSPNPGVAEHLAVGRAYPNYLSESCSRIANPGQSFQALTVGSVGYDEVEADGWRSISREAEQPSAFSRSGFGIWGNIKPDVVEFGGDYLIDSSSTVSTPMVGQSAYPELVRSTLYGGPAVAQDDVGTSYSTPKVARIASRLAVALPDETCLLYRALIVQSAQWPAWTNSLDQSEKVDVLKRIGYGIPSVSRASEPSEHRVTFTTSGVRSIGVKQSHVYQIPLPEELRRPGDEYDIRIDVTLSYSASPRRTRRTARGYLAVWLDWIASRIGESANDFSDRSLHTDGDPNNDSNRQFQWTLHPSTQHGLPGVRRSVGTVQKDWAEIKSYQLPESLSIAVRGHQGWSRDPDETASYALAVTFEIIGKEIPIYEPLRNSVMNLRSLIEVEGELEIET